MTTETKSTLNQETIEAVQQLIRANIDSYDGLRTAAEQIEDATIAHMFLTISEERSAMASELQNYVEWNGEDAEREGTFGASVRRAWLTVRSKLNSGDPYVILIEAERGEDHIKDAYEDVLKQTAGSAVNDVLQTQYACVKAAHDRVRELRDAYKQKS